MKDIRISPYKEVQISHRIYHFASKNELLFGCCSEYGIVTILDRDFNIRNVFNCAEIIKWNRGAIEVFGFHTFEDVFYIGGEEEYRIYHLNGKLLCSIPERVDAVHYSKERNLAWIVKRLSRIEKEVCLIVDNIEVDRIRIKDELVKSAVEFYTLPEINKVCMMFIAGENGMMTYFLSNVDNKIVCNHLENLDDISSFEFSEDKKKFISVEPYGLDCITTYLYPSLIKIDDFELTEEQLENENKQLGFNCFFIDDKYAMAEIGENLYYVLNTESMELTGRFIVAGHEPKPVSYYWPRLTDDNDETTNLSYFHKTSKYLIAPYKNNPTDESDNSFTVLLLEDIKKEMTNTL